MRTALIMAICILIMTQTVLPQGSTPLEPEQIDRARYGLFVHFNLNDHVADFQSIPGIASCCPQYKDGSGTGFSIGLLYEYPVIDKLFIGARLGYYGRSGELEADELVPIELDGDVYYATFGHTLDTKLSIIALEPMAGYNLFDGFFLHAGLQLGLLNIAKDFDHVEVIKDPPSGTYENNQRQRLPSEGELTDISSFHLSLLAGASYEIPLNGRRTWLIAPEIFYTYGLNNNHSEVDWKINTLRFGAAVKYTPSPEKKYMLSGDINASSLNPDGTKSPVVTIQVEEFLSTNMKPLLTYVFFDENSSDLPGRYNRMASSETASFNIDDLYSYDAMETYYHVLNIIGKRMIKYPDAKIAIEGCNADKGPEKNNMDLSQKRSETVFNYLRNVWNIEPERMKLSHRNLPLEPSNIKEADGIQENRRVEITSNKWEIIAPVVAKDTFRTVTPPKVRFEGTVNSEAGLKQWIVTAMQNDYVLKEYTGTDELPDKIDWQLDLNQKNIPTQDDMLDYSMSLIDQKGQVYETPRKSLPVEQVTVQNKIREKQKDKYIDRFSLILFSYDESQLSFYNEQLATMINDVIQTNSEVTIKGHTDRLGKEDYNMSLSNDRANVVKNFLKSDSMESNGYGETELKYNNNLPEGRFYCRRVDILVATPIEHK